MARKESGNKFKDFARRYESVGNVEMGEGSSTTGKNALKTENLATCLGVAVSSISEKVARLAHFPGQEEGIYTPACDFIEDGLRLTEPRIKVISPFASSKLDKYTEKPINRLRQILTEGFGENPTVQLEFLTRGLMASVLAVGTDGEFYSQTKRVPEIELLRGDLNYELNFHAQRNSLLGIPHPVQIRAILNRLKMKELTQILMLPEEEKTQALESLLAQILSI